MKKNRLNKPLSISANPGYPRMVGEPWIIEHSYTRSTISRHADRMHKNPTPAEKKLIRILNSLNSGVLKRRFTSQHVVSGKWIVDIFFYENRLAIEIDGSVHYTEKQKMRDRQKEQDCARFDITLLRLTNAEVFGDREQLIEKLRHGWRMALRRKNKIIGKANYPN